VTSVPQEIDPDPPSRPANGAIRVSDLDPDTGQPGVPEGWLNSREGYSGEFESRPGRLYQKDLCRDLHSPPALGPKDPGREKQDQQCQDLDNQGDLGDSHREVSPVTAPGLRTGRKPLWHGNLAPGNEPWRCAGTSIMMYKRCTP